MNDLLPDQKFIDLIDLLEGKLCRSYPNRKLMTTDKKHFTPHGSKYAGKILFDYLELQNIYRFNELNNNHPILDEDSSLKKLLDSLIHSKENIFEIIIINTGTHDLKNLVDHKYFRF